MNEAQESNVNTGQIPESPVSKNLFRDFFGIIFDPGRTFLNIIRANYWVGIVLVVILVSGGLEQIYHNQLIDTTVARMIEKAGDNPGNVQQAVGFFQNQVLTRILFFLSTVFGQIVFILIWTVLCFFLCSIAFGGTAKFKNVWMICSWAYVIILVQMVVKTPLILATKSIEAGLNFGLIFSEQMVGTKLHNAISVLDLFGIWHFVVIGIGLAALYRFTTKKGIGIAFIVWLLSVIVSGTVAYFS